jgi:DNA-binding beta-propeller fold protein YncE
MSFRALAVAIAILAPASTASAATPGSLSQLPGTQSCVTGNGNLGSSIGACTAAPELGEANSLVISPDGKFAYVNGWRGGKYNIVVLARNATTGALSPLAGSDFCLSEDGSGSAGAGTCTNVRNLGYSYEGDSLAMTKDGSFLYVGGWGRGVAIFSRDAATGKLTQLGGTAGCVSKDGSSPDDGAATCIDGRLLDNVHSITLSPDERFAYVTSVTFGFYAGVAVFSRNTTTGALTQLAGADGCVTGNGNSEDGAATCTNIRGGAYAGSFSITPDGKHAYLPDYDNSSLAILTVDPATGKLSQASGTAGCVSKDGASEDGADSCQDTGVLDGVWGTIIAPDGRTLAVADYAAPGVATFRIDPATGALTRVSGTDHCVTDSGNSASEGAGSCQNGRGLDGTERLTLSTDGTTLYAGSWGKGVAFLTLDPATGRLSQPDSTEGCYTTDGGSAADGPGSCTDVNALDGSLRLALSPDDLFGYMPSPGGAGTGSITVLARRLPPVCTDVAGATPFQTPFALTLACSDPNGDAVTREIVTQPGHGSLAAIDQATAQVTFTPAAGFSGPDSFTFRATDGALASAPATAAVTVGSGPVTPPTPTPTPTSTSDKTKPSCKRSGGSALSVRKPVTRLRCNEAAVVALKLTLPAAVAKKLRVAKVVTIATARASLKANSATNVRPTFTRKAKKRLLKLSTAKLSKLRATLTISATDAARNKATLRGTLKLKR